MKSNVQQTVLPREAANPMPHPQPVTAALGHANDQPLQPTPQSRPRKRPGLLGGIQVMTVLLALWGGGATTLAGEIRSVGGTLTNNTRWTSGVTYLVTDNVTIPVDHTLALEPGVVVKFAYTGNGGGKLGLTVNGTLALEGTAAQPVVFTSSRDDEYGGHTSDEGAGAAVGDWAYLQFNNPSNVLHHAVVRYGGFLNGHNGSMVWLSGSTAGTMAVHDCVLERSWQTALRVDAPHVPLIESNVFRNSTYGLYLAGTGSATVRSNLFTLNTYPLFQGVRTSVLNGNELIQNTHQVVAVGGTVTEDLRWAAGNVYVASEWLTVPLGHTLTLEPGVVVKFAYIGNGGGKLGLTVHGTLALEGTAAQPVVFTSSRDDEYGGHTSDEGAGAAAGDWAYLQFNNPDNVLHHAVVRYGGFLNGHNGSMVWLTGSQTGILGIQDCMVERAYQQGIRTDAGYNVVANRVQIQNVPGYGIEVRAGQLAASAVSLQQYGSAGVYVAGTASANLGTCNFVDPEKDFGVLNASTHSVTATGNWWGDASGPSTVGPGSGVKVSTNVVYSPWATAAVPIPAPTGPFRITSWPNLSGMVGVPYRYDDNGRPTAVGGGPVTWSKPFGPSLLAVDPATGLIDWTPGSAGNFLIGIAATDGTNADQQIFIVQVGTAVDLTPPVVTSFDCVWTNTGAAFQATLTVMFSEPELVDAGDISIQDDLGQSVPFSMYSYWLGDHLLIIDVPGLVPSKTYRLVLTDTITDLAFNPLDGEFNGHHFPSGDGSAGGRFIASFRQSPESPPSALFGGITSSPGGPIRLSLTVVPGYDYRIEASSNLADWFPVWITNPSSTTLEWSDPEPPRLPGRFYRVVSP
jgi:parallel beta-helix repeat protein